MPKKYFPRVAEARAKLAEKANELINLQLLIINSALAAGDFETAAAANQWLLEHMPSNPEATTLVDVSVDKPKQIEGSKGGPTIQIGFKLGGMEHAPKELQAAVIDAESTDNE